MPKAMLNFNFAENEREPIARTKIRMPYQHDTAIQYDYLYPLHKQWLIPGDEISCSTRIYARLSTPKVPIMHNIMLHSYYFKIPLRLIFENFRKWMGERLNVDDSIDYQLPIMDTTADSFAEDSLWDYLNAPTKHTGIEFQAAWSRAYNLCWNKWFRNQFWQDEVVVDMNDGPDDMADYELLKINNAFDFITSMLPEPQMGDPVMLPLGDTAPVIGNGETIGFCDEYPSDPYTYGIKQFESGGITKYVPSDLKGQTLPVSDSTEEFGHYDYLMGLSQDPQYSGVIADLSEADGATVSDFREALQKQALLELRARTGNSYREIILAEYGVRSPDASLQYPEYLGGSKQYVNIHQVVQQGTEGSGTTPPGTVNAFMDVFEKNGYHTYIHEPSIIIGLFAITAEQKYQEQLNKIDSMRYRDEYYTPLLANLGEEPIYMKEFACRGDANDEYVIGYGERWSNLRFNQSVISGSMRSNHTNSVDVWHCARDFTAGGENITRDEDVMKSILPSNVPTRHLADPSAAHCIISCDFDIYNTRNIPMHSIPAHLGNL